MGVKVVDHSAEEGGQRVGSGQGGLRLAGAGAESDDFLVIDRLGECFAGGEMAVQRAGADPGQAGEIVEAQVEELPRGEEFPGLGEQGVAVAPGVGAQGFGVGHAGPPG